MSINKQHSSNKSLESNKSLSDELNFDPHKDPEIPFSVRFRDNIPVANNHNAQQNEHDNVTPAAPNPIRFLRPLVEWIYPQGNNECFLEEVTTQNNSRTFTIDPSQTTVIPIIEGEIVPTRRCFIKIFSFRVFDDNFLFKTNPSILIVALIITLTAGLAGGLLYSSNKEFSLFSKDQTHSISPSEIPTFAPTFDARTMNITESLLSFTGAIILEADSPQNRALTWILYEDGMNLSHESSNLVQRYTLMVLYFSMSGDHWINKDGYGTDRHECDWYGTRCIRKEAVARIQLENNNLVGKLPQEIGFLSQLREISFRFNRISGSIPTTIGLLKYLQINMLDENNLSGTIPEEIGNCPSLTRLLVRVNRLSGTIPSSLGSLRSLGHLSLRGNQLSGTIPSSFSELKLLHILSLNKNKLTGTIPAELGMCQFFELLNLEENKLNGSVPSSLGNLEFLKILKLSNNILSGTIPKEFGMLSNLDILHMKNNHLTGTIPGFIGSPSELKELILSNNMISGTIPFTLGRFDNLNKLQLHENMLTGEVNEKICELRMLSMTTDCLGTEPEISCTCCTGCY